MKKIELEIRLCIAESIIKESILLLSSENIEKICKEKGKEYSYAISYSMGQAESTLGNYENQVLSALSRNMDCR